MLLSTVVAAVRRQFEKHIVLAAQTIELLECSRRACCCCFGGWKLGLLIGNYPLIAADIQIFSQWLHLVKAVSTCTSNGIQTLLLCWVCSCSQMRRQVVLLLLGTTCSWLIELVEVLKQMIAGFLSLWMLLLLVFALRRKRELVDYHVFHLLASVFLPRSHALVQAAYNTLLLLTARGKMSGLPGKLLWLLLQAGAATEAPPVQEMIVELLVTPGNFFIWELSLELQLFLGGFGVV